MNNYACDNYEYVIVSNSLDLINAVSKTLYKYNCNSKFMIIISDLKEGMKDFLKLSWTNYKMLNVINFQINQIDSIISEIEIELSFYDPFLEHISEPCGIFKVIVNNNLLDEKPLINFENTLRNRLLNLHQYPIPIGVINFPGYLEIEINGDSIIYTKIYGNIMNLISNYMNFTPISIFPPDIKAYGGILSNGTAVGLWGLLEREEVELSANIRVANRGGEQNWTLSAFIGETSNNFISPNMHTAYKYTFVDIVGKKTYIALTLTAFLLTIIEYSFHKLNNYKRFDIGNNLLVILAMFLTVSYKTPKTNYNRRIFLAVIFMAMVVNITYQGNMVKILATETKTKNLESLADIIDTDFRILLPLGKLDFEPFATFGEETSKKMRNRTYFVNEYQDGIHQVMYQRDCVFLVLRSFIDIYGYKWYSNETETNLIHMISDQEEPMNTYLALMILKRSPYRERIDDMVRRIREGGLYDKIYDDSVFVTQLRFLQIPKSVNKIKFSLEELRLIFILWGGLMGVCVSVFFLEVIYKKVIDRRILYV